MAVVADAQRPRGRWRDALEERRFLAPLLISPAVLYIVLLVGAPLGLALYLSLTDATAGSLTGHFVGMHNYADVWHSENFRRALRNTIFFTLVSQAVVLVGADFAHAAIISREPQRVRPFAPMARTTHWRILLEEGRGGCSHERDMHARDGGGPRRAN